MAPNVASRATPTFMRQRSSSLGDLSDAFHLLLNTKGNNDTSDYFTVPLKDGENNILTKRRRSVGFLPEVDVGYTFSKDEYNREILKKKPKKHELLMIRLELNKYKQQEMVVHPESEQFTQLFPHVAIVCPTEL
eukprot:Colp12_sorted_trinity150504_noHs@27431